MKKLYVALLDMKFQYTLLSIFKGRELKLA